jgi:hypothetical protein
MNRISAITILSLAATCAGAIAQQPGLKANIPFDFTVGNAWMPAGEYTITTRSSHVLELSNPQHLATIMAQESNIQSNSGSKLVFDKYGEQYFLHEVLCPNVGSLNLEVALSKAEKNARHHATEAKLSDSGKQTMVAAR